MRRRKKWDSELRFASSIRTQSPRLIFSFSSRSEQTMQKCSQIYWPQECEEALRSNWKLKQAAKRSYTWSYEIGPRRRRPPCSIERASYSVLLPSHRPSILISESRCKFSVRGGKDVTSMYHFRWRCAEQRGRLVKKISASRFSTWLTISLYGSQFWISSLDRGYVGEEKLEVHVWKKTDVRTRMQQGISIRDDDQKLLGLIAWNNGEGRLGFFWRCAIIFFTQSFFR